MKDEGEGEGEGHRVKESDRSQQALRALLEEVGLLHDGGALPVGPHLVDLIVDEPLVVLKQLVVRRPTTGLEQPELKLRQTARNDARHLGRRRLAAPARGGGGGGLLVGGASHLGQYLRRAEREERHLLLLRRLPLIKGRPLVVVLKVLALEQVTPRPPGDLLARGLGEGAARVSARHEEERHPDQLPHAARARDM